MNLTIRLLGCEVLAITTDSSDDNGPQHPNLGDATAAPLGFTRTTPLISDGRYGFDDE